MQRKYISKEREISNKSYETDKRKKNERLIEHELKKKL